MVRDKVAYFAALSVVVLFVLWHGCYYMDSAGQSRTEFSAYRRYEGRVASLGMDIAKDTKNHDDAFELMVNSEFVLSSTAPAKLAAFQRQRWIEADEIRGRYAVSFFLSVIALLLLVRIYPQVA